VTAVADAAAAAAAAVDPRCEGLTMRKAYWCCNDYFCVIVMMTIMTTLVFTQNYSV